MPIAREDSAEIIRAYHAGSGERISHWTFTVAHRKYALAIRGPKRAIDAFCKVTQRPRVPGQRPRFQAIAVGAHQLAGAVNPRPAVAGRSEDLDAIVQVARERHRLELSV